MWGTPTSPPGFVLSSRLDKEHGVSVRGRHTLVCRHLVFRGYNGPSCSSLSAQVCIIVLPCANNAAGESMRCVNWRVMRPATSMWTQQTIKKSYKTVNEGWITKNDENNPNTKVEILKSQLPIKHTVWNHKSTDILEYIKEHARNARHYLAPHWHQE